MLANTSVRARFAVPVLWLHSAQHRSPADPSRGIAARMIWTKCATLLKHKHPTKTYVPGSILWNVRLPVLHATVSSGHGGAGYGECVFRNISHPQYRTSWFFCPMEKSGVLQRYLHYTSLISFIWSYSFYFWLSRKLFAVLKKIHCSLCMDICVSCR